MIVLDRSHWPYISWRKQELSLSTVGHLSLLVSVLCGATFNGFAKTLGSALSAFSLVFVSEVLTFFLVLFSFGFLPTVRRILRLRRSEILPLICIGTLSGIVAPLLWFTGLEMTTAVNAGLFGKTEVIFLLLMAHFTLGEKIERAHVIALFTILGGILFVSLRGFTEGIQLQAGDLVIILATIGYGSGNILYRKFIPNMEPFLPLFARSVSAITAFFIISSFTTVHVIDEMIVFPLQLLPPLIGFAFVSRFLNSILYYQAIEYVPVTTVSLFSTVDVILGVVFSSIYLGETIEWYHVVGGALVLLGNILLTYFKIHVHHGHHQMQPVPQEIPPVRN